MAALTLLDAQAIIALLRGERAAESVRDLIREGTAAAATVNLAETADILTRRLGVDQKRVRAAISALTDRPLAVLELNERRALRAAELRADHYHRTRRPLSLADCVLLASADRDDRIASADEHVLAAAADLGTESVQLPQGRDRRAA